MKTIISKLRKCLCLTLSIFFLTSNSLIFGQEISNNPIVNDLLLRFTNNTKDITNDVRHLRYLLKEDITTMISYNNKAQVHNLYNFRHLFIQTLYKIDKTLYNLYDIEEKIISLTDSDFDTQMLQVFIKRRDNDILIKLFRFSELFYSNESRATNPFGPVWFSMKDILSRSELQELEGYLAYLENRFPDALSVKTVEDLRYHEKEIYIKTTKFFHENASSADILKHVFKNGMSSQEQAGIKLSLEAMDSDVPVNALVKNIRQYLTDFANEVNNNKYLSTENLTKQLKEMTFTERTEYVAELTKVKSGTKAFMSEFNKLDKLSQRNVSKNIIHGTWVSIGLIAGLTLLFELIPQNSNANNINKSFEIVDALDDISYKIENGEATMPEMLYFYTIPENENLILKDPVHTLNFVKLTEGVMAAEEILEAEKENQEEETKATNEKVENSILKRYMEMQQNKKVNVENVNVADFSF